MRTVTESQDIEQLKIGTVVGGRYRIDAVLGVGAMGCVYRGEHLGIGRTVAIKVLRSDLGGNQDATRRFKREALASGRLDHPNIVGVSDFGVLDDGTAFLVMEALVGESLRERLERDQRIPWSEAVELMRAILRGLHHAHERGVVHRDIKPDNIFLARQDERCVVKLLDFGIAKLVAGNADDPASTRTGLTMGTPAYLSPEQAVGGVITPATDLYSVTVVLFEMITGRAPFEEPDLVATMVAHISKPPPTLAAVAPDVAVPPQLEAIVERGLQKLGGDRISSAVAYLELLDGIAGYLPRVSGRFSAPYEVATIDRQSAPHASQSSAAPSEPLGEAPTVPVQLHSQLATSPHATLIPRRWVVRGAIVLGLALPVVLAVVRRGGQSVDPDAPSQTSLVDDGVTAIRASASSDTPAPDVPVVMVDRGVHLKALLHDLASAPTCADRRAVVPKLVELDDPRAIPALKAARYRMYGGVLGFRQSNANACLTKDADAAIKALGRKR